MKGEDRLIGESLNRSKISSRSGPRPLTFEVTYWITLRRLERPSERSATQLDPDLFDLFRILNFEDIVGFKLNPTSYIALFVIPVNIYAPTSREKEEKKSNSLIADLERRFTYLFILFFYHRRIFDNQTIAAQIHDSFSSRQIFFKRISLRNYRSIINFQPNESWN